MNNFILKVQDSKNEKQDIVVQKPPDSCPCCHTGIEASYKFGFIHDNEAPDVSTLYVQAIFQCPRKKCSRLFIVDYVRPFDRQDIRMRGGYPPFQIASIAPYWHKKHEFPKPVQNFSALFCKIFDEAVHAEALNLLNVAGPGYRKALEILVKDFLISEYPKEADAIRSSTKLQSLIQSKIQDANLKACAERATWLGNDEVHYNRKWEDKDINDFKALIKLTVNWIENYILTREIQTKMPPSIK